MDYQHILHKYWGFDSFRGIQRQIIESLCSGCDTLGLMPTGGGKSITFQVPAMALDGVCIVVTPLIALMKDQVVHLRKLGIRAAALYSGMSRNEIAVTLDNAVLGGLKLLYVSPERLQSTLFQTKVSHMKVSFIAVDEAHCISQWGYDFRPSYLEIARLRQLLPHAPVLALTATATPRVADDIQHQLRFRQGRVFSMSFQRTNLAYVVRMATDKNSELLHILNSVTGSAIVYVGSRRRAREISDLLSDGGLASTYYHAALQPSVKDACQRRWQNNEVRVMVATSAFGMGIDKPDVRLVIHMDCPDSLEAYFQEAGRAGRDGLKAYAVLLYNGSDRQKLTRRTSDTFPEKEYIRTVYEHLAYFYQIAVESGKGVTRAFDIDKFCHTFHHYPTHVDASLRLLQRAGYIEYETDPDNSARVMFLLTRNELNRLDQLNRREEAVVTALLRNYGGLFTDYSYIDEAFVAAQAGDLSQTDLYLTLKSLSARRIIHYVPRRLSPYITYSRDRVDGAQVAIPPTVYEHRRQQHEARIKAMLDYATNHDVCRSRQLLRYFGETNTADCLQCDVCIDHKTNMLAENRMDAARQRIMDLLADGERHHLSELKSLDIPTSLLDNMLEYLIHEEIILVEGSVIFKP